MKVLMAIVSGLKKRYDKVGFIKPVIGQQHVEVKSELGAMYRVDKEVCLVREHFHLNHLGYEFMESRHYSKMIGKHIQLFQMY